MDYDSGTQDSTAYNDLYESSSHSYNAIEGNAYETDRNDYSLSKGESYSTAVDKKNVFSTPDNSDSYEYSRHCLPPLPQESTIIEPSSELVVAMPEDDLKGSTTVDDSFNLENADLEKERFTTTTELNQEASMSEKKISYENEDTGDNSDCCSCGNDSIMCFAILCDCFGL